MEQAHEVSFEIPDSSPMYWQKLTAADMESKPGALIPLE